MRAALAPPPGFSFVRTVLSHGWCRLPPFETARDGLCLATVVRVGGAALAISLRPAPGGGVVLETPGRVDAPTRRALARTARRVLNLDFDLSAFHAVVRDDPRFEWIAREGAGRLLRGATTFEDLVKLVLTTNCSWALTTRMTAALVELYGERSADGRRAFPDAPALAGAGESELRERVRAGYRAPLLARLAERVASGKVDLDRWEAWPGSAEDLRREMLALPGVGPYVAENMLKLLGRPNGLALDSWMRAEYARRHHGGRRVTDRTIARRYARLGEWAAVAVWCELTRDWVDGDDPDEAWDVLG